MPKTANKPSKNLIPKPKETPTITNLENELHTLGQSNQTGQTSAKIVKLKNQIKQQKELNKLTATKMEVGNLSHLIFFDSTNGYAKLAGNSAIIYVGSIAKRIGRRVNLRQDTDNYAKSDYGIVSIRLTDELTQKLSAIGIVIDDELSTSHIHAFRLDQPISASYFEILLDTVKKDSEQINKTILPQNPIPTLFIHIKELIEICYYNTKSMPDFSRHTFGTEIAKIPNQMLEDYLRYAENRLKKSELAQNLYLSAKKLKHLMKTAEILHLISNRNICRILERAVAIERLAAKYYKEGTTK